MKFLSSIKYWLSFFYQDTARIYLANSSWLFLERVLAIFSSLLIGIWIARYLGPEQYGLYSYIIAFVAIFASFANLGVDQVLYRELVKKPEALNKLLGTAFMMKVLGSLLAMLSMYITLFSLADTMGWAAPHRIEHIIGEVRSEWPDMELSLHLHDTRGLAVANAYAGLKMGVRRFDSTVGGLGGCPFAGQPKAAGNICTEELVLLCEELGIKTGVNLDRLIEVGRMAEDIVGHQLPGELIHAGSLDAFRRNIVN